MRKKRTALYENPAIERYHEISHIIHDKPAVKELRGEIMAKMSKAQETKWRAAVDAEIAALSQEDRDAYNLGSELSDLTYKIYHHFHDRVEGGDLELIKAMHGGHNHRNELTKADLPKKSERSGYNWLFELTMGFLGMCNDMTNEQIRHIAAVIDGTAEADEWVPLHLYSRTCYECNKSWRSETNGKIIRCVKEHECEFPTGMKEYSTFLDVPSGKMVVCDDLREAFPITDDDFNVNTRAGIMEASTAYEKIGMGYGFCGNTCPGMYSHGRGKVKEKFSIGGNKGTHVAGICTDLWWYSLADLNEYLRRMEMTELETDGYGSPEIVECKPGKYKITHHGHYIDRDKGRPVYATLEWVGEADPPQPDEEVTVYFEIKLGEGNSSLHTESYGNRERAENHLGIYMGGDCEGLFLTEEVYPNANAAAIGKDPISVKVLATIEEGKATSAPTPELLESMQEKVDGHKRWREIMAPVWEKEEAERNAKLTPDELKKKQEKRERENAPYQTETYKENGRRMTARFYEAMELARQGKDYHGHLGGSFRLMFASTQEEGNNESGNVVL